MASALAPFWLDEPVRRRPEKMLMTGPTVNVTRVGTAFSPVGGRAGAVCVALVCVGVGVCCEGGGEAPPTEQVAGEGG